MIKSRACLLESKNSPLVIKEIGLLPPKEKEVLVRLVGAGLCRSDLNAIEGHTRYDMPLVLGHEGVGIVVEIGPSVTTVAPGDRVILSWAAYCGECLFCKKGETQLCHTVAWPRGSGKLPDWSTRFRDGDKEVFHFNGVSSFSEYTVLYETGCVKIDNDIPDGIAAVLGCSVVTGVGAVLNTAKPPAGSTCMVVGAGSVGMSVIQALRISYAGRIALSEPDKEKWPMAEKCGVTDFFEKFTPDCARSITDGLGVDFVFDTVAAESTIADSIIAVRRGGTVVLVGTPHPLSTVTLSPIEFHVEKKLIGSLYGSSNPGVDIARVIDFYKKGELDFDGFINAEFAFEDINLAIEALKKSGGKYFIRFDKKTAEAG